jgi:cysteine desulfurase / selenocysteine lyase
MRQKMPPTKPDWDDFRRRMPVTEHQIHLDHAAVAPLTGPAHDAILNWSRDAAQFGTAHYPSWMKGIEDLRVTVATMTGADLDEIALLPNTTAGINAVAEGYPWKPGDNVVTRADEFPSNQYPWLYLAERGVEIRRLEFHDNAFDIKKLADAIDGHTRIVTLSWVSFSHGWRHDLDEIADLVHRKGALFFLDAIQGLGAFPIDVKKTPVDFLAADGHKWMMGPEGAGVFFIRKEWIPRLKPIGIGWNSVKKEHDFHIINLDLKETAVRYEGGTQNVVGFLALGASLALLERYSAEDRAARVVEITDYACEKLRSSNAKILSNREKGHESGIVLFEMPGRNPELVKRHCREKGITLSCRAGRLRISPHCYNNESEIDRFVETIREMPNE